MAPSGIVSGVGLLNLWIAFEVTQFGIGMDKG